MEGQTLGLRGTNFAQVTRRPVDLVGTPTEVSVIIEGVKTAALLDTGSTVSTVSQAFYEQHLHHIEMKPLDSILKIECADGQLLPYEGFIEAEIEFSGTGLHEKKNKLVMCIFLVVPPSPYNTTVPVLIGTNVLAVLMTKVQERHGTSFLQSAKLITPLYLAFRCMIFREKELERHNDRLAIVRCAGVKPVTILPNSDVVVEGYTDKRLAYPRVCALLQSTSGSSIPDDLDIVPSIVPYCHDQRSPVQVHISNMSTRTVTIQPKALLCEMHPVSVEDMDQLEDPINREDVLSKVEICTEDLSPHEVSRIRSLLEKFRSSFATSDIDIGQTDMVRHRIDLVDNTPFKQRCRRIIPSMFEEVRNHLQQLLAAGIIQRSHSPWASNVVLVRKKSGALRMCVDYRQLNRQTIKDAYALPRVDEMLDSLAGNRFFSVIDMKSGYHQVELHEEHKERTAFTIGPLGFYEYTRMPFGLANAPATYQRLMEEVMGELHTRICYVYIDDVIVFAKTYEEHLHHLELVFERIADAGLKLAPDKCSLFKRKVKYVGHVVSENGIEPDPDKVEKVVNWPRPENPEDVRRFLGFIGYYRRFIKNFSRIARPLTILMPAPLKTKGTRKKDREQRQWIWESEQEEAFQHLKNCLSGPPVVGYPNFDLPFELHTDASLLGLGAVLYQDQGGTKRVIAYASRGLSKAEKRYPAHKLEFLALKWAVTEKLSDYLNGRPFTAITDNNPLTYILTSAKLDATSQRWVAALGAYNFDIRYRPGTSNADADSMSRHPSLIDKDMETGIITNDVIKAINNEIQSSPCIESVSMSAVALDPISDVTCDRQLDVAHAHSQDPSISMWIPIVKAGIRPQRQEMPNSLEHSVLLKNFEKLRVSNGILYREILKDEEPILQQLVPRSSIPTVLTMLHDDMGHQGRDRTLSLLQDRFFWAGMTRDAEDWVKRCDRCLKRKTPAKDTAPLVSIHTHHPLELVCMDYLGLETSKGGYANILVITDHFTRYAVAIPTRNMTARTTAEAFINNFVVHYGLPRRIHSDQGANFMGKVLTELCDITGMEKSNTTPYHPQANGLCERFNHTLQNMLGTLAETKKQDWKSHVSALVHAYNCTRQHSTGQTPYYLMFGRNPRLPVDLAFGVDTGKPAISLTAYVESLRQRLARAYEIAAASSEKAKARQKDRYDTRVRGAFLTVGDRALVKIVAFAGKHKLADKWEEHPYLVVAQPNPDIPVYDVKREDGVGRLKTLHRNLLLPINFIPRRNDKPMPAPRARKPSKVERRPPDIPKDVESEDDTSTDEDVMLVLGGGAQDDATSGPITSHQAVDSREDSGSAEQEDSVDGEDALQEEPTPVEDGEGGVIKHPDDDTGGEAFIPPTPRRSLRAKKKPGWMRSGAYVCAQQTDGLPDWQVRARFLAEMSRTGLLRDKGTDVAAALLSIITGQCQ